MTVLGTLRFPARIRKELLLLPYFSKNPNPFLIGGKVMNLEVS
jgi:hypothetical protein